MVDGRAHESLLVAGGGGVAADADLERITLLLNQQASGVNWFSKFCEANSLELPLPFLPHSSVQCCAKPCATCLQGRPLLAAKSAPSDAQGYVHVPLVGGTALLPELSVTGETRPRCCITCVQSQRMLHWVYCWRCTKSS